MANQVSKSQFKARALEFFREIEATGKPLIVTDHGKPTLEIRRVPDATQSALERLKGSVLWYDRPFDPAEDPDEWEALK